MLYRTCLERIIDRCDGAVGGVIMSMDGAPAEVVYASTLLNVGVFSVEFSDILAEVTRVATILKTGALSELIIRNLQLVFLVRMLDKRHFVGLAMTNEGNIGMGRFLIRLALPELTALI